MRGLNKRLTARWRDPYALRLRDRSTQMHRLPRVHRRLQGGEPGSPRGEPHVVKYIEKGTFPDTRRYFSVLRCNHCDNAPCVTICPTVALYRRSDGIVD